MEPNEDAGQSGSQSTAGTGKAAQRSQSQDACQQQQAGQQGNQQGQSGLIVLTSGGADRRVTPLHLIKRVCFTQPMLSGREVEVTVTSPRFTADAAVRAGSGVCVSATRFPAFRGRSIGFFRLPAVEEFEATR